MNKVLIVTPNWPPVSCPDLHRVRMALPYFAEFGWEPLILKINPAEQEGIKDPELCRTVPAHVKTWQAGCLPLWLTKWTGLRNVGLRSYFHLARLGDRIILQEKPQVIFFSTTMFTLMTLGRYWQWRHGIPYILDFQDPWRKEKQKWRKQKAEIEKAEGGNKFQLSTFKISDLKTVSVSALESAPPTFKGKLADWVAGVLEPFALRCAAHVVSVSPAYPRQLRERYPWLEICEAKAETLKAEKLKAGSVSAFQNVSVSEFASAPPTSGLRPPISVLRSTVLPFGAAEADYEFLRASPVRQTIFSPQDGKRHWVYVGRGGGDMNFSLMSFFAALARALKEQPALRKELQIHFIGTSYAPKGRATKTVEPLTLEYGLDDVVNETTDRIPYFEALQCLLDADALFIPGSDDPGYTASKLYPYILARKPLLAVFHEASSVVEILNKTKAGTVVGFKTGESCEAIATRILATNWLSSPSSLLPATDWTEFAPYTAREMTRKLCEVFDAVEKLKS